MKRMRRRKGGGNANLPRQDSKESSSETWTRVEPGGSSILAASSLVRTKRSTCKASKTSVAKILGAKLATAAKRKVISSFVVIYYSAGLALDIVLQVPFCCQFVRHVSPCDAFSCVVVLLFARGLAQRWMSKKWFL